MLNLAFTSASVHEIEFANSIRLKTCLNSINTSRLFPGLLPYSTKRLPFLNPLSRMTFAWKVQPILIRIILRSGFNSVHGYLGQIASDKARIPTPRFFIKTCKFKTYIPGDELRFYSSFRSDGSNVGKEPLSSLSARIASLAGWFCARAMCGIAMLFTLNYSGLFVACNTSIFSYETLYRTSLHGRNCDAIEPSGALITIESQIEGKLSKTR